MDRPGLTRPLWLFGLLMSALLLAACEGEPTPFPAELPPTLAPTAASTDPPPVRYAITADSAGGVLERTALEAAHVVEVLTAPPDPADLGPRYDVVAGYGLYDGWQTGPVRPLVLLVANPAVPPLDASSAALALRAVDPTALIEQMGLPGAEAVAGEAALPAAAIRETLANAGRPDGLGLVLGLVHAPGETAVQAALDRANIRTRLVRFDDEAAARAAWDEGRVHLLLALVAPDDAAAWRDGPHRDLFTLPISYNAVDGLRIDFTPGGWPLASRE
ncbi:MAG: hypothetical protein ACOCXZ_02065 [Chloroflexota bacterium]